VSRYTHQDFCGSVPRTGTERFFERIEQQFAREDEHVERSDFGEADEAAASTFVRDAWDWQVDLGGILAQADFPPDGGRA
jgi:hypothetical protein